MKKLLSVILMLAMVVALGCAYSASQVKTSYDVLSVSQQSYDVALKTTKSLYDQGLITDEKLNKVLEIASVYEQVHNTAVDTLIQYQQSRSLSDLELLNHQLSMVSSTLSKLLTLVKELN